MAEVEPDKRKSHCAVCGKRLSRKATDGSIHWQAGQVDDTGLYCEFCYVPQTGNDAENEPNEEDEPVR